MNQSCAFGFCLLLYEHSSKLEAPEAALDVCLVDKSTVIVGWKHLGGGR